MYLIYYRMRVQSNFDFYNYISRLPYYHFFSKLFRKKKFMLILKGYNCLNPIILHLTYTIILHQMSQIFILLIHVLIDNFRTFCSSNQYNFSLVNFLVLVKLDNIILNIFVTGSNL